MRLLVKLVGYGVAGCFFVTAAALTALWLLDLAVQGVFR